MMTPTQSPQTLWTALAAATASFPAIQLDSVNPHFRSRYSSLAALQGAVKPALQRHGLLLHYDSRYADGVLHVSAILQHVPTGESISATAPVPLAKNDPQGAGSAITYGRRYALGMLLGLVAEEDDDGERATHGVNGQAGKATGRKAATANGKDVEFANTAELRRQVVELGQALYGEQWAASVCTRNAKRVSGNRTDLLGELTANELSKLIDGMKKLQRQHEAKAE
jgi:hypothetical protein